MLAQYPSSVNSKLFPVYIDQSICNTIIHAAVPNAHLTGRADLTSRSSWPINLSCNVILNYLPAMISVTNSQ